MGARLFSFIVVTCRWHVGWRVVAMTSNITAHPEGTLPRSIILPFDNIPPCPPAMQTAWPYTLMLKLTSNMALHSHA
jgi:hypothetical protein